MWLGQKIICQFKGIWRLICNKSCDCVMDDDGTDNGGVTSSVLPDLTSQEQFSEYYQQPVGKCILIGSSYYSWYVVSLLRPSSPASLMDQIWLHQTWKCLCTDETSLLWKTKEFYSNNIPFNGGVLSCLEADEFALRSTTHNRLLVGLIV